MADANTLAGGWHEALTKIDGWVDGLIALVPNLIVGGVVFAVFLVAGYLARRSIRGSFRRRERHDLGAMLSDFAFWLAALLGLMLALTIILPTLNPGDLVASLGIGSIAIGFAFKDILQNWLAGLLILLRQPFRRGDQIEVGKIEGTVQRITQRATLIKTYDGRLVVVPNADIYTQSIVIHTAFDLRRISVSVTVGYDNDVETVRQLIETTLAGLEHDVLRDPPPQVLCWELGATSLGLVVRWWTGATRSAEVASRTRVVQAIKEAFQANGIDPTDPQIIFSRRIASEAGAEGEKRQRPTGAGPLAASDTPRPLPRRIEVSHDDPENAVPRDDPGALVEEAKDVPDGRT